MLNHSRPTTTQTVINYDTTPLTNEGYELKFTFDSESPDLQEAINQCKKHGWAYKIVDGVGLQKHVWVKEWIKQEF